MNTSFERPMSLLAVAMMLGVAAQVFFHPGVIGINVVAYLLALAMGVWVLARFSHVALAGDGRWLLLPALLFAGAIAWRASPVLQALNTAAVLAILAVAAFRLRDGTVRVGFVTEAAWHAGAVAAAAAYGAIATLRTADLTRMRGGGRARQSLAIARGLAVGLPLLVVFGVLFAMADDVFLTLVRSSVSINVASLLEHGFGWLVWSWVSAGVLAALLGKEPPTPPAAAPAPWAKLGPIEVSTALGLLDLLFLAFVAVQIHYLFGGAGHVEATAGLTYAEYARRGFFELLAVAALVLPVVLGIHWLLKDASAAARLAFRVLSVTLILLLFVVIASALERMRAYVDEFGLTQLRLYSTVFILWLAVTFAWLLATILRERRQRFVGGAFATGLVVVAALNVINPDAFIVRTNLERSDGRGFDTTYALSLSPDATPTIVAGIAQLTDRAERCALAAGVVAEYPASQPWQGWNLSRTVANDAVRANAEAIESACQ